jgi:hypothetical protein
MTMLRNGRGQPRSLSNQVIAMADTILSAVDAAERAAYRERVKATA